MNRFADEGSRRILIVEDEAELRIEMVEYFKMKGFEVTDVSSAMQAISVIQSKGIDWDFLITDYSMPGMNGSDLINWCSIWRVKIGRTILLSGNPPPSLRNEKFIKDFGAIILSKPISMSKLHEILIESPEVLLAK